MATPTAKQPWTGTGVGRTVSKAAHFLGALFALFFAEAHPGRLAKPRLQLVVPQVQPLQPPELPEGEGEGDQAVAVEVQPLELGEVAKVGGQFSKSVAAQVQLCEVF